MRELRAIRVSDDGKEILLTETTGMQGADAPPERRPSTFPPTTDCEPCFGHVPPPRKTVRRARSRLARSRPGCAPARPRKRWPRPRGSPSSGWRATRRPSPPSGCGSSTRCAARRHPGPHRVSPGRQLGARRRRPARRRRARPRAGPVAGAPPAGRHLAGHRRSGRPPRRMELGQRGAPRPRPRQRRPAPAQPVPQQRRVADRGRPGHGRHHRAGTRPCARPAARPPAPLAPARAVGESTVSDAAPSPADVSALRARRAARRGGVAAGSRPGRRLPPPRRPWTTSPARTAPAARRPQAPGWTPATTRFPVRAASRAAARSRSPRLQPATQPRAADRRARRTSPHARRQVRQAPQRGSGLGRHRLRRPALVTSRLRFQNVPCL